MSELSEALDSVRKRIARYQGKHMNEQNTKTALIDPILRALGWDVGDLEQVEQEYKRRPRDKPVDYALLVMRTPRLFVEAKALGQDVSDRKWANQIMGYASVAGVEWVVITNGEEYRIYNACAPVPIEEKLFRKVHVTQADTLVEETLGLLSKSRISDNEIEILWNAHFVDRQIGAALERLFSVEPDSSLVRLVKKRVKELSSKDIRASLRRVQVRFDFPVEPESGLTVPVKSRKAAKRRKGRVDKAGKKGGFPKTTRRMLDLGLSMRGVVAELIREGFLRAPLELTAEYRAHSLKAELLADGAIAFEGKRYKSPSGAARDAKGTVTGRPMATDGWEFWHYRNQSGAVVPLDAARQEYLRKKGK